MAFRCPRSLTLVTVALATSACASTQSGQSTAAPSLAATPASVQWSGSFQATQQQAGNADAPRGRNNASGSVRLFASGKTATRARITLSAASDASQLHWALVSGRCGSPAIPLLTVSQFPDISMSNGRGQVDAELPLELPTSGTYHVDVFWSNGQDQADVLTCANLRMEARSQ